MSLNPNKIGVSAECADADTIRLSSLNRMALEAWAANHGLDAYSLSNPEHMAYLFFRLRLEPDTPEVFPGGKWATLQSIEAQLEMHWRTA